MHFDVSTDDLRGRVLRGGVTRVTAQGVLFVTRLGSVVVLARLLDPSEFGLVNMVTVFTGLIGLFRDAGLSMLTVQRPTISHEQLSALFWVNVLVGAALMAVCAAVSPAIAAFYGEPRLLAVALALSAGFLVSGAAVQPAALLNRHMRFTAMAAAEVIACAVGLCLGIVLAALGWSYWALVGMNLSQSIAFCLAVWAVARWLPSRPRRGVGMTSMMRFGGAVSANSFLMYLAYNTDKLLLGRVAGAEALGVYGRAYALVNVPTQVLDQAISSVAISALSRLQGDDERFRNYFLKGYALFAAIMVPIGVACMLFADDVVLVLLGSKWTTVAPLFRSLAPTVVAIALVNPIGWLLFATARVGRAVRMALVIALVLVASYSSGLPYGPQGVAVGFSVAMAALVVPLIVWGLHDSGVPLGEVARALRAPVLATLAAVSIGLAAGWWLTAAPWPFARLAMEGTVFSGTYLLVLLYPLRQKPFYVALLREIGLRRSGVTPGHS